MIYVDLLGQKVAVLHCKGALHLIPVSSPEEMRGFAAGLGPIDMNDLRDEDDNPDFDETLNC
jgi:hypothetical protein